MRDRKVNWSNTVTIPSQNKTEQQNKAKQKTHKQTNQNTQHKTNRAGEKWPADQLCDLGNEKA
jgi:hypothetical protein